MMNQIWREGLLHEHDITTTDSDKHTAQQLYLEENKK